MELVSKAGFYAVKLIWEAVQASMKVDIHNKCSNIELVEPVYFSDGATCDIPLDQKIEPNGALKTVFRIKFTRGKFEGAILYRLRKKGANSDQQPDTETTSNGKNQPNRTQLLVGWKLERLQDPRVYMLLVEHEEKLVWDGNKLIEQHNEFRGRLNVHNGSVTSTWLMEDGSVLRLALDGVGSGEYGIRIVITDAQQNEHTSIPIWIEPKVDDKEDQKPTHWNDEDKPTSTAWRGGEAEFVIENHVEDIALQRGTCNVLEGKERDYFSGAIRSEKPSSMRIKASMNGLGKIRCYLTYELVRNGQERLPTMRSYRTFLAIEVFSTTITRTCAASAAVFMVKSRRFTGEIGDVEWLHDDVLKHHRVKNGSSFRCNIGGQVLRLDVDFQPDKRAKIKVVLRETDEHYNYGPVFHRANNFAASSNNVSRYIYRTAKSSSINVGRQHYQAIENRIESAESDKIYIQRIDADTGDNRQTSVHSPESKNHISNGEYQIYQQEISGNEYSGSFTYCISMDGTKDDVKTVCILMLKQATAEEGLDGRPNFKYEASLFYINIPLQKITTDQTEQPSDAELKKHITQATAGWNSLQEFAKMVPFSSGRLWEMPIQFTGHEMVHLSIHEPLSRPSVLNVVLQKYSGFGKTRSASQKEDKLPTFCIKIRNYYPKSNFRLKRYTYTDTPLSEVPNQLTRVDPGSPNSFNTIKFKLLPSALVDTHEPHKFILHYCCEDDERIGFYLIIMTPVLKRPDNLLLVGSYDLKIEMRYIDENLRQNNPNNVVKYNSRISVEDDGHYYVKDYFCKDPDDMSRAEFTITARHELSKKTPPDSEIDLNIVPM